MNIIFSMLAGIGFFFLLVGAGLELRAYLSQKKIFIVTEPINILVHTKIKDGKVTVKTSIIKKAVKECPATNRNSKE